MDTCLNDLCSLLSIGLKEVQRNLKTSNNHCYAPTLNMYVFWYRMLESLGSGQFGQVYKATWSISKELAIKTMRADLLEEEKVRFLQEAAIMWQLAHPHVVKLYGVVTVGDPVSCTLP